MRVGAMAAMNIRRILGYAIVLLVLRVAIGFVTAGFPVRNEVDAQLILQYLATYLLDAIVVIAVVAKLAKVQLQSTFLHVLLVVLLQELISAALLSALGWSNSQSPLWLLDWAVLAASALLGLWIGRRLRAGISS